MTAASSSTLSPHAAPFALPACAPPGRLLGGDVPTDGSSIAAYVEDKVSGDTHSVSPSTACFGMKSRSTVLPSSTHGVHSSQPRSQPEVHGDAYLSSICSTSVVFSYPSVMMTSHHNQKIPLHSAKGSNGSKCSTVKIESPPNKMSETNNISRDLVSKSSITESSTKSNEGTGKNAPFPKSLEASNLVSVNGMSQDAMIYSKETVPISHKNPLHIPIICTDPCNSVADGAKPDPSECSVDSPCWRGTSVSHLSSFNLLQTSAPQSINQEKEAFGAGQKESTGTVQHYEALPSFQNVKKNHSQSHVELGMPMESVDIGKNKNSHNKGLENAKQCATKCTAQQKHSLELRDNRVKRSGLNSAAPDFVPSSVGKLKISEGPCSTTGRNISGILKAIENLSEMLRDSYSFDEIELEEHDHTLLQSVIENLQNCLHKTRKGLITDDASNKEVLKALHSPSAVLKSDAGNYNGSYRANVGKDRTTNNFTGTSHVLNNFGKNSLTWSQPSVNNIPVMMSHEEDHSQILIYKNLWIEAERANCELKYLLKHTYMKIGSESSMAFVDCPRNPSSQACDFDTDRSNLHGAAISCSPTLSFPKGHPTGETSRRRDVDLHYSGDCIQLGDEGVLCCSASTSSHPIRPKNYHRDLILTSLEETGIHRHAHPVSPLVPSRDHRELKPSTMDEVSSGRSFITGGDNILRGSSQYDSSSDWEHVLKEEIGWS